MNHPARRGTLRGDSERQRAPILYVLKRFPRLSETFVLDELLRLEASGERILIDVLLPPEDGPRQRGLNDLKASVRYLPRHPRLRRPSTALLQLRLFARRPSVWLEVASRARHSGRWRRFLQAGLVADRVLREGARHLHAHFATAATEVARDAAALAGVPVTVTAHAKDIFQADNALRLRERLEGVSAVVTISDFNAGHLRRVLPGIPVHHVPPGIELGEPVAQMPEGSVLCVARLVPKKGVDALIEAFALLRDRFPSRRLEIIGDGPLRAELARLAAQRGIADRVAFLGPRPREDVERAFDRCSIFVLPCRIARDGDRDGMPTVLLEAMARSVPVISTRVGGIPELVQHEQTGLLVAPDDPSGLARAIARLLDDPSLAHQLGINGRALVAERFDPQRNLRLLQAVFGRAAA